MHSGIASIVLSIPALSIRAPELCPERVHFWHPLADEPQCHAADPVVQSFGTNRRACGIAWTELRKTELGMSLKESDYQLFRDSAHGCYRADGDLSMTPPLRVMKFGGTSVGDAACIARAAAIVKSAAAQGSVVVVVSAMSGVTNRLIDAAHRAEAGERDFLTKLISELRAQHKKALEALVRDPKRALEADKSLSEVLAELERLLQGTALLKELTSRALDAISGMGERLSTPVLAAALNELGVSSVPIAATEVIVTDPHHGRSEPLMEHTRIRAEKCLRPLLKEGIVPVVTGFIGATLDGVPTTLGRGGSDYSATILGAALGAQETVIWTDVDGVKTADPKLVPEARTLDEISYNEAAELAYFGAKVLHPNTLRPVTAAGVPVWIRNSFAPEKLGTKITAGGVSNGGGVKALTAIRGVTLDHRRAGRASSA